jgi:hypothetical protein
MCPFNNLDGFFSIKKQKIVTINLVFVFLGCELFMITKFWTHMLF